MNLYDEEEKQEKKQPSNKTKKIIIATIFILMFLIFFMGVLIIYIKSNPTKVTVYINGAQKSDFASLLDFQTDENGKTEIYIPIKDVAPYFNYLGYNGEYKRASEDPNTCYVISEDLEVAMYEVGSNKIYKLDLQKNSNDYDYCTADRAVFQSKDKLYTTVDGAEKGFNISINYDEEKKVLTIYTLPYLAEFYQKKLEGKNIANYGVLEVDNSLANWKAIFDDMLIINKEHEKKYGVISTKDFSMILEPKYDNIEYVQYAKDFVIETNGKVGLLSKEGDTKVNALYDELTLMDRNNKLYKIKKGNGYGVINENENVIIYPEYQKIGIDIGDFAANGIKSGYIVMNKLIPTLQDDKWGFFDLNGKKVTDFLYEEIGCKAGNANNVYSLLEILNYNIIVVGKNDKYSFMDITGNDKILPYGFVFDEIFMRISSGEISYCMKYNKKDWNVIEYLNRQGITEVTKEIKK